MKVFLSISTLLMLQACGQRQRRPTTPANELKSSVEITQIENSEIERRSSNATSQTDIKSEGSIQLQNSFLLAATKEITKQEDIEIKLSKNSIHLSAVEDPEADYDEQKSVLIRSYLKEHESFDEFVGWRRDRLFKDKLDSEMAQLCLKETLECTLDGGCEDSQIIPICTHKIEVVTLQLSFQELSAEDSEPGLCFLIDSLMSGDDIAYIHLNSLRTIDNCLAEIKNENIKDEEESEEAEGEVVEENNDDTENSEEGKISLSL